MTVEEQTSVTRIIYLAVAEIEGGGDVQGAFENALFTFEEEQDHKAELEAAYTITPKFDVHPMLQQLVK
jgi:hypothetical protein